MCGPLSSSHSHQQISTDLLISTPSSAFPISINKSCMKTENSFLISLRNSYLDNQIFLLPEKWTYNIPSYINFTAELNARKSASDTEECQGKSTIALLQTQVRALG